MSNVRVKIFRFDPSIDKEPHYESYEIPYEKDMRVLGVLTYIRDNYDQNLAFRHSCKRWRCGTCGVLVNEKPVLACREAAGADMVIEPLPKLPVIRDLMVDTKPYEAKIHGVRPCMERVRPNKEPELLVPLNFMPLRQLQTCIECYLCMSACPVLEVEWPGFSGPAALVQMARRALDPRDTLDRVSMKHDSEFVDCVSCYACVNVCPIQINVLQKAVEPLKKQRQEKCIDGRWVKFNNVFMGLVRDKGMVNPSVLILKSCDISVILRNIFLGLRFFIRGKARLVSKKIPNIKDIRKIYGATEGEK